jgi:hypothetical protein
VSKGRPTGSKNKATQEMRMVVADFIERNSNKMQGWLEQIEIDDGPLEAFKRIEALLEYSIPKLARTEHTGDKENPVSFTVKWGE